MIQVAAGHVSLRATPQEFLGAAFGLDGERAKNQAGAERRSTADEEPFGSDALRGFLELHPNGLGLAPLERQLANGHAMAFLGDRNAMLAARKLQRDAVTARAQVRAVDVDVGIGTRSRSTECWGARAV